MCIAPYVPIKPYQPHFIIRAITIARADALLDEVVYTFHVQTKDILDLVNGETNNWPECYIVGFRELFEAIIVILRVSKILAIVNQMIPHFLQREQVFPMREAYINALPKNFVCIG